MKSSELRRTLATLPIEEEQKCCTGEDEEEEETEQIYDDDDFWEAIDLLESSKKSISAVLRYNDKQLNTGRKQLLNNLRDDIGTFLSFFIVEDPSKELHERSSKES